MVNRFLGWLLALILGLIATPAWAAPESAILACDEAIANGSPAVEACERAVGEQPDSAYARASLALALLDHPSGEARLDPDRPRALELTEQALAEAPNDFDVQLRACQVGLTSEDLTLAKRSSARMLALDDEDYRAHLFASIVALSEGDGWAAYEHYREARSLDAPPEALADLEGLLKQHVPWYVRTLALGLPVLVAFVVIWLVVLLGLIVAGGLLSGAVLRQAETFATSATGEGTPAERRLRKIYRLVLLVCSAFYYASLPMVLLTIVLVFSIIVLLQLMAGVLFTKITAIVAFVALASMLAVLRSVFVRVHESDPGLVIDVAEHRRLRALLERIAGRLETRSVDVVFMTPGTELAVYERGTIVDQLRGSTRRCMILGAGVLGALDVRELSSVLAHEYGHFRNADTSGGAFALATRRSLMTMANHLARAGTADWYNPAWLFLLGYHKLFLRISQGASRQQEVLADRWAAQAFGSAAFIRGMRKVIEQDLRFDAHVEATLHEVVETKTALANLYRYQPSELIENETFEARVREVLEARPSPYDSHPRPADRLNWVERLNCTEPEFQPGEQESSWSLFDQREQLEEEMTDVVREHVQLQFGVQIPKPSAT